MIVERTSTDEFRELLRMPALADRARHAWQNRENLDALAEGLTDGADAMKDTMRAKMLLAGWITAIEATRLLSSILADEAFLDPHARTWPELIRGLDEAACHALRASAAAALSGADIVVWQKLGRVENLIGSELRWLRLVEVHGLENLDRAAFDAQPMFI